jgi:hypothetical protein
MRYRLKFMGSFFKNGGQGSFSSETFYNSYENLIQMEKFGGKPNLRVCRPSGGPVR